MAKPSSPATTEFGRRVREQRDRLGYSQEAFAVICGLHWTYIGQVERGQRNLSLHNILKIAKGLEIDPAKLVKGLEPPDT